MRLVSLVLIAVKATLLLAGVAHGEVVAVSTTTKQCTPFGCRIVSNHFSGFTVGVLRDGRTAILSCAHCVEPNATGYVWWYNDAKVPLEVIARGDAGTDVALLAAKLDGVRRWLPLLDADPADDTEAVCIGFLDGTRPHRSTGTYRRRTTIIKGAAVDLGMSGGCVKVANSNHSLGVVMAKTMDGSRECVMTPYWVVRPWLERTIGYVPEPPAASATEPTPIEQPTTRIGCDCGRPNCRCRPDMSSAPTPTPTADNSAVLSEIAALKAAIAAIPAGPRGERGERGERGPAGPQGPPGRDGKDGETVIMPAPPATPTTDEGFIMAIKPRDPTLQVVESNLHIVRDGDGYKVRVIYPDGRMGDVESIKPGQRVPVKVFEGAK